MSQKINYLIKIDYFANTSCLLVYLFDWLVDWLICFMPLFLSVEIEKHFILMSFSKCDSLFSKWIWEKPKLLVTDKITGRFSKFRIGFRNQFLCRSNFSQDKSGLENSLKFYLLVQKPGKSEKFRPESDLLSVTRNCRYIWELLLRHL